MITLISELGALIVKGVSSWFTRRQELKQAAVDNRARLLRDEQSHNQEWEIKSLLNAGWKDDVLFYAVVGMYVFSAIDPDRSAKVFQNWEHIPEWFSQITFWLIASVLGVKKLGDYIPGLLAGIKEALRK